MTKTQRNVMQYFKPPFKADKMGGYIFDSNNQMIAEVRAWGYLQYKPDAERLQDDLCENIAESLNKSCSLSEENLRLKNNVESLKQMFDLVNTQLESKNREIEELEVPAHGLTKEEILDNKADSRYSISMPFGWNEIYEAMQQYADQESSSLFKRVIELEGALRGIIKFCDHWGERNNTVPDIKSVASNALTNKNSI